MAQRTGLGVAFLWARRAGLALLALAVGLALWMAARLPATLPQLAGEAKLPGLAAPARIVRDAHGVPHLFADNEHDLYAALGYAHAQDRFFQMDLTRRSVEGTLAEIVGGAALPLDARARIKNFNAVIAAQTASLSPQARAMLDAYADGVNARLAQGAVAPEYELLFTKAAPWRVEDSVAVGVAMTNNLTLGAGREIARAELSARLNAKRLDEFFPPYPAWAPGSVAGIDVAPRGTNAGEGIAPGSNAWVLAGKRTASGKPILANDPHLDFSAPGPFYLVHLKSPAGNLIGATLPGAPVIVIGRNDFLAWTNTTNEVDAADVIAAPAAGFQDVRTRSEWIWVRALFGARRVEIKARETAVGPIVDRKYFDIPGYKGQTLALRSVAFDRENHIVDALMAMNRAKSVDEFIAASHGWTAPLTHVLVAARNGDVALISTGQLPVRDKDGVWTGFAPGPIVKNPAGGLIATANNLALPSALPGAYAPYRITRIRALLDHGGGADLDDAAAMQLDQTSVFARRVLPALVGAKPKSELAIHALAMMRTWTGEMDASRPEPLIFAAWIDALSRRIYADDLGPLYGFYSGPRRAFLDAVLTGTNAAWCDNAKTAALETCADLTGPALDDAVAHLRTRYGANPETWRWGAAHRAVFAHPLIGPFSTSTPIGGDGDTIFASEYVAGNYAAVHGPSLRAVFDLGDLNRSRFVVAPGQSGNPLSPHYKDLLKDWASNRGFEIRDDLNPGSLAAGYETLALRPR